MFARAFPKSAAACLAALLAGTATAAGTAKSGPQVDEKVPGPFAPLNVNGPDAGKRSCLYCRNGSRPAAMIFARSITPELVGLMQRLEAAAASNERLGAYVIFCGDDANLPAQLAQLARQANLSRVLLATFNSKGPARYQIASDADVTVVLYTRFTVKANHAFKQGELTAATVGTVLADLPRILAQD